MNKNKLFLGCCMLAAGLLTGCSNDNDETTEGGSRAIVLRSSVANLQTRADDHPYTQIMSGQEVGIYVHATGKAIGTLYGNKCFTSGGGGALNCTETLYYPESGTVDIVAYHPKQASLVVDGVDFLVEADQSTDSNYYNSDLLHAASTGVSAQSSAVALSFSHLMSNVVYTLNTTGNDVAVTINSVEKAAKFNIKSGTVDTADTSEKGNVVLHNTYGAVVAPQTIAANSVNFSVTVDGTTYSSNNVSAIEYKSGKIYKYNLKITAGGLTVDECEISDWDATASEITGGLVAVTQTVTYCPSFTEVGNTVTLSGENLSSISSVTVGGEAAKITSKSDTSITIEMPSDITTTTAAAITFDGTEVVADTEFSVVNSVLWDGNMENASLGTGVQASPTDGSSVGVWAVYSNKTAFTYQLTSDGQYGSCFEFSNGDITSSWYGLQFGQEFVFPAGYTKGVLKFRAKTDVATNNQMRIFISQGGNAKFIVCEDDTSISGYRATGFTTEWKDYSVTFDFTQYTTDANTAPSSPSTEASPEGYYHIRFTLNSASTILYYIDNITLEPTN